MAPSLSCSALRSPSNRNPKPETRNPKPETRNPKPEARSPKPETRDPKSETRTPKPETRNQKPETRNTKPETRNLRVIEGKDQEDSQEIKRSKNNVLHFQNTLETTQLCDILIEAVYCQAGPAPLRPEPPVRVSGSCRRGAVNPQPYMGTSILGNTLLLGPCSRTIPRDLWRTVSSSRIME